ncbi:MAG: class I SAM-dependent methyltransferase [bacterium]
MGTAISGPVEEAAETWAALVRARSGHGDRHSAAGYWDRRAASFARNTAGRADPFLDVVAPFLGPRKTLIDVGAGAGRHAAPLADRLEWVTAVEPSEGMRGRIPHRDNMTVVASDWEDAEVAPADLVISCHVLYGIERPVPFINKMESAARERVFIMLREGDPPHVGAALRSPPERSRTRPTKPTCPVRFPWREAPWPARRT